MLDEIASAAAARIANHLLRHDTAARARLARFEGRTARIDIMPFSLLLMVSAGGTLMPAPDTLAPADVRITLAPASIAGALADPATIMRDMRIDGAAEFAQTLAAVLPSLRPDLEEELAPVIGDIAAVRAAAMLHSATGAIAQSARQLARATADYLAGEQPVLAARPALDALATELAGLAQAVERLGTRVDALARPPR